MTTGTVSNAPDVVWPGRWAPRLPGIRAFGTVCVVGAVVLSSATLLLVTARPMLALLPLLVGLLLVTATWIPPRVPFYLTIGTAIIADLMYPAGMAPGHLYARAVRVLSWLLLENLNKLTGIEALRVSGMEVLLVLFLVLAGARALTASVSARARVQPRALTLALTLALAVVVGAEVWGIARGGDLRQSLWQVRYVSWLPLMTLAGVQLLREDRVLPELGVLLTTVGLIKALLVLLVIIWSTSHGEGRPPTATSHADTVLFTVVCALWAGQLVFRPSLSRVLVGIVVITTMLLAIVGNNRRTAFVTLPVLLLILFFQLTARRRRRMLAGALALAPLLGAYLMVGRHRTSTLFIPAQLVWSVSKQEDSSSDSREVENANLAVTQRQHLLLGSGFGHPYVVKDSVVDLSGIFAQYRFVAHNSVLWLFGIAGPLGATLLWLPHVVAIFIAARSIRLATVPFDQVTGYVVIATIAAYLLQAWADMGTQGWTGTTLVAMAFVATGLVARRTGALPEPFALFRFRRSIQEIAHAR